MAHQREFESHDNNPPPNLEDPAVVRGLIEERGEPVLRRRYRGNIPTNKVQFFMLPSGTQPEISVDISYRVAGKIASIRDELRKH